MSLFLDTLNSDGSLFLSQLSWKRVIYLKRKPYYGLFERRFETGRILALRCYRQILVKVMLFQLRWHGHPQDDATPNFPLDFKRSITGLSNDVPFVSEFLQKSWVK